MGYQFTVQTLKGSTAVGCEDGTGDWSSVPLTSYIIRAAGLLQWGP